MSTIKRFENIDAWQKARELAKMIYQISKREAFKRDFSLVDQTCLRQAGRSTVQVLL